MSIHTDTHRFQRTPQPSTKCTHKNSTNTLLATSDFVPLQPHEHKCSGLDAHHLVSRVKPWSGMVQSDVCSFCSNALAATGRQAPVSELLHSLLLTSSYLLLSGTERKARQASSVTVTSACTGDCQEGKTVFLLAV